MMTPEEAKKKIEDNWTRGKIDIKRAVTDDKRVYFRYYADGSLWYETEHNELFPVAIDDLGTATLWLNEKALLLMRYMRMWNKEIENSAEDVINAIGGDMQIAGGPND